MLVGEGNVNGHSFKNELKTFLPFFSKIYKMTIETTNGNYRGYSKKRNGTTLVDPRLNLFPQELLQGKRVLDIGCNSGEVTVALASIFKPSFICGMAACHLIKRN
jgi:SAM-dependent methyltransferase